MKLNKKELNAVLAGLRLLQRSTVLPSGVEDVLCDGDEQPLDDNDIDELCERLNVVDEDPEVWVLAIGSAFDGITIYGPYPSYEEANVDASDYPDSDWHVFQIWTVEAAND